MTTTFIIILIVFMAYLLTVISAITLECYVTNNSTSVKIKMFADDFIHLVLFDYKHFK